MGRKNGVCLGRCMCWRNHDGKKVICKNLNLSALSGFLGHFKSEFRKKRKVVIFAIMRSGTMQKSKKKKTRKKNFLWDVFPCDFSISGDKKGGKSKWFCFFP